MNDLTHVGDFRRLIDTVKAAGGKFGTNFFMADAAIEAALRDYRWSSFEAPGAALLLQREAAFDRVYYAACGTEPLVRALAGVPVPASGALVSDVVGDPRDSGPWVDALTESGFARRTSFQRMLRAGGGIGPATEPLAPVQVAGEADAAEILAAITANFDVYAEHIPLLQEVRQAAAAGGLLVAREGGALAGILYYDRTGFTTLLRYWLALPGFRGRGHADALMWRYLRECAACRRFLLWVQETNARAMALYRGYGYNADSIADVILMKR